MTETIRLRPFQKLLEATNNVLRASGEIDGNDYVLTIGQGVHRMPMVGRDSDQWGPFALVEPCEVALEARFHPEGRDQL